jgi:hypothetical protein
MGKGRQTGNVEIVQCFLFIEGKGNVATGSISE